MLLSNASILPGKIKFNKALWTAVDEGKYKDGNRPLMLDDLLENHQIKGLKYKQVVNLLGPPANWGEEKDIVGYQIITDYGSDIDPVYTKSLIIKFNKDSVATEIEIRESKN